MQFTTFGRTGLQVSRLTLGTGTFGKQTNEADSFRIFDQTENAHRHSEYRAPRRVDGSL